MTTILPGEKIENVPELVKEKMRLLEVSLGDGVVEEGKMAVGLLGVRHVA